MIFLYGEILWLYVFALFPIYAYYKKEEELRYKRKVMLLSFVFFLLLFAFARPVLPQKLDDVKTVGTEIVVAVDLSASMQAKDLEPSRALKASKLLHDLVTSSKHDKFAILGFTSSAIILSTMTDDKSLLFELFGRLNRQHVVSKATKLNPVFTLADKLSLLSQKQLVLFTDGGEDDLSDEISFAKEHDIRVYPVGVATQNGASLTTQNGDLLLNEQGEVVVSALNPELKRLASQTGGRYFEHSDSMADVLDEIYSDALMHTSSAKELSYEELFYYPLILALVFFMMASTSMLSRYIAMLSLFIPMQDVYAFSTDYLDISYTQEEAEHLGKDVGLDFWDITSFKELYKNGYFIHAAKTLEALGDKNWQTLYNKGVAYYYAKDYKSARSAFSKIKTTDKKLKAKLLFNIANTYAHERLIKKAIETYRLSLALDYKSETEENLLKVAFYEEKLELFSGRFEGKEQKDAQEQEMSASNNKSRSKASKNQQSTSSTSGGGKSESKPEQPKLQKLKKVKVGLSSKQYETINKGKYNEKTPW